MLKAIKNKIQAKKETLQKRFEHEKEELFKKGLLYAKKLTIESYGWLQQRDTLKSEYVCCLTDFRVSGEEALKLEALLAQYKISSLSDLWMDQETMTALRKSLEVFTNKNYYARSAKDGDSGFEREFSEEKVNLNNCAQSYEEALQKVKAGTHSWVYFEQLFKLVPIDPKPDAPSVKWSTSDRITWVPTGMPIKKASMRPLPEGCRVVGSIALVKTPSGEVKVTVEGDWTRELNEMLHQVAEGKLKFENAVTEEVKKTEPEA